MACCPEADIAKAGFVITIMITTRTSAIHLLDSNVFDDKKEFTNEHPAN
jgi:hypothetical protein